MVPLIQSAAAAFFAGSTFFAVLAVPGDTASTCRAQVHWQMHGGNPVVWVSCVGVMVCTVSCEVVHGTDGSGNGWVECQCKNNPTEAMPPCRAHFEWNGGVEWSGLPGVSVPLNPLAPWVCNSTVPNACPTPQTCKPNGVPTQQNPGPWDACVCR